MSRLGEHNLYLTHLGLVLGARRLLSGGDRYDELHERIARHLARASLPRPPSAAPLATA